MATRSYSGAQPYFPDEDRAEIMAAVEDILVSGSMTQGPYLKRFEAAAAEMAGTRYALGVNSGGTALEIALEAVNVKGKDVIVPTETFVATANSVVRAGGRPIFADLRLNDLAISESTIAAVKTPNTAAVIIVHMFGLMSSEIAAIQDYCRKEGLVLIEDAAHAHGASFCGRPAGSLGQIGCFSYYATKVLTTGEGGVITTSDDRLAEQVRRIRDHGRQTGGSVFDYAGNNFRLAEIPAAIGVVQQRRLAEIVAHRRRIAAVYRNILHNAPYMYLVDPVPHDEHSYWRYAILLDKGIDRQTVQRVLLDQINARVTWMYEPLCHQQPLYAHQAENAVSLPVAESVVGRLINLPTHSYIDEQGATDIAHTLYDCVAGLARHA
ncbi:DegT/DnrJ/EryC1/StrS family aminotransferase [Undibacter mobilis]|nr:DegT/DnrJ/EryC1/StrS family aminotransferase [Undibacter mobilis]